MKALLMILFLLSTTCHAWAQQDQDSSSRKYYDIKSGRIVWRFINGPNWGEKTLVFDDWGRREKMYGETHTDSAFVAPIIARMKEHGLPVDSIPSVSHMLYIKTGEDVYQIDLDRNIGYQQSNPLTEESNAWLDSMMQQSMKIVGQDTILGRVCEIKQLEGGFKISYWKKLALRKQGSEPSDEVQVVEYAIEIDENYAIKPDEFDLPEGIVIEE